MAEIDAVFRDLEAGLFLQTRAQRSPSEGARSDSVHNNGLFTITFDGRRVELSQGLIGRDFVAWVDAHGLSIVPGRLASIRLEKSTTVRTATMPRFVKNHKLSMLKYLRGLAGQPVRLEVAHSSSADLTGPLVDVRGEFAVIDLGSSVAFVELSRIMRVLLPVHNFSEQAQ
jgi:hypothetical protein